MLRTSLIILVCAIALAGCRDRYAYRDHRVPRQYGDIVTITPRDVAPPIHAQQLPSMRYSAYRR